MTKSWVCSTVENQLAAERRAVESTTLTEKPSPATSASTRSTKGRMARSEMPMNPNTAGSDSWPPPAGVRARRIINRASSVITSG